MQRGLSPRAVEESNALGAAVERILLDVPEVAGTARRTGRAELDEHVQGVESSEIDVRLAHGLAHPGRSREAVLADVRERLSLVPGAAVTVGQPISHRIDHMLSGARASIAVRIFGPDLGTLRALGEQAAAAMQGTAGLVDLAVEPQADVPTVRVGFDRGALARHGLPAGEAASMLETALLGRRVGQILDGEWPAALVLRYRPSGRQDLDAMRQTRFDVPEGARVPLGGLADVVEDRGPNFIGRENAQRRILVTANVAGRDLVGVAADVRERVTAGVTAPDGYRIEFGGRFEAEAAATRRLLGLGAAAAAGIFAILLAAFRSARDAAVVMVNPPAGADRRRRRRLPRRRSAVDRLADRVHRPVRRRRPQRRHAGVARPALAAGRRGFRSSRSDRPGGGGPARADPDDGALDRARPVAGRAPARRAGERDPGAARAGHRLRAALVDRAEPVRRAGGVPGGGRRRTAIVTRRWTDRPPPAPA